MDIEIRVIISSEDLRMRFTDSTFRLSMDESEVVEYAKHDHMKLEHSAILKLAGSIVDDWEEFNQPELIRCPCCHREGYLSDGGDEWASPGEPEDFYPFPD